MNDTNRAPLYGSNSSDFPPNGGDEECGKDIDREKIRWNKWSVISGAAALSVVIFLFLIVKSNETSIKYNNLAFGVENQDDFDIEIIPSSEALYSVGYVDRQEVVSKCQMTNVQKPTLRVKYGSQLFQVEVSAVIGMCENLGEDVTFHGNYGDTDFKLFCGANNENCSVYLEKSDSQSTEAFNTLTNAGGGKTWTDRLPAQNALYEGDCIVTSNGDYSLCLTNGELIGSTQGGSIFWRNNKQGAVRCTMQWDVNFVCYDDNPRPNPIWATNGNRGNPGTIYIAMQQDRNIVVYSEYPLGIMVPFASNTKCNGGRCSCGDDCGGGCFSANAKVEVYNKGIVTMQDLQYGDQVETVNLHGDREFNEVYLFGHRDDATVAEFVNLQVTSMVMTITPTHFARVCESHCSTESLWAGMTVMRHVYAKDVVVGDVMLVAGETVEFASVERVWRSMERGLYNPYVRGGNIVVDGTVASVHSEWVLDHLPFLKSAWLPGIYETMFLPVFLLYKALGAEKAEQLASWVGLHGKQVAATDAISVAALLAIYGLMALMPVYACVLSLRKSLTNKR